MDKNEHVSHGFLSSFHLRNNVIHDNQAMSRLSNTWWSNLDNSWLKIHDSLWGEFLVEKQSFIKTCFTFYSHITYLEHLCHRHASNWKLRCCKWESSLNNSSWYWERKCALWESEDVLHLCTLFNHHVKLMPNFAPKPKSKLLAWYQHAHVTKTI